jgi:hypothetical protein
MRQPGILAAAMVLVAMSTITSAAHAEFGAFAYDQDSGKYGVSWNERDQKAADAAALKGCASDSCKIVFRTGPKQCGAIAMTEDGKVWGGARRDQRAAAELAAIQNCQQRTSGQCKVRGSECNR